VLISQTLLFIHFWTFDLICKMVHGAPQCWAWALSLCFCFLHLILSTIALTLFLCSEFRILWNFLCPPALYGHLRWLRIFFYAPQYCLGTFIVEDFLCPPVLFGHFQSLRIFGTCPPSVGCDPSQGYFQKTLLGSKGDCKGYILALWEDYQRWPFFISNACI
jgi:hypothetical protein